MHNGAAVYGALFSGPVCPGTGSSAVGRRLNLAWRRFQRALTARLAAYAGLSH